MQSRAGEKFVAIKLVVFLSFWQGVLITGLVCARVCVYV
jgi:hypothetical protein